MSTVNGEKTTKKYCQKALLQCHSKCEGYCVWSPYPEGHGAFIPRFAWEEHGSLLKLTWEHCVVSSLSELCLSHLQSGDHETQHAKTLVQNSWWILNTSYLSTSLIISSFLSDKNSVIKENFTCQKQQVPSLGVMERIGLFWMACNALV